MDIDLSKMQVGDIIPTECGWLVKVQVVDNWDKKQPIRCLIIDGPATDCSLWYSADGSINIETLFPYYKEYRLLHQWRYYHPEKRPEVGWKLLRGDGKIVEVRDDDGDDYAPFLIDGMWYKYEGNQLIGLSERAAFQIIHNIRYIGE